MEHITIFILILSIGQKIIPAQETSWSEGTLIGLLESCALYGSEDHFVAIWMFSNEKSQTCQRLAAEAWHRLSRISCCSLRGRTLLSSVRASSPQKGYQAGKWELSSLGIFSQPLVNKNLVKWSLTAVLHHAFPLGTQWVLLASVSCITQVRKESRPSLKILRCIGPHQRDTGNSKAGRLRHWQGRV